MPTIEVDETHFYYELYGEGKPVVFIAGYTAAHTAWLNQFDPFSQNFQVVLFDNCAVGQTSDNGELLSIEIMADRTMGLIDALSLENPHIIGHSMGGNIAQMIAIKYPEKIDKVVIMNSVSKWNVVTVKAFDSLLSLREMDAPIDCQLASAMPWYFGSEFLGDVKKIELFSELVVNNPYPQSLPDQIRQLHALKQFDGRNAINTISVPALVVSGEEDIVALPEESKTMAEAIPGATFLSLPGGHCSILEQPAVANKKIMEFL